MPHLKPLNTICNMDSYMASIMLFAGTFAPQQWMDCAGQTIQIQQNTALFSLIGTTYGGNGTSTFMLPDLRGRVAIGAGMGQASGLSNYALGQVGGAETVTLNINQMPAHSHTLTGGSTSGLSATLAASLATTGHNVPAQGDYLAVMVANGEPVSAYVSAGQAGSTVNLGGITVTGTASAGTISQTGGNQPHSNIQPFLGLRYIICTQGIYPPRP